MESAIRKGRALPQWYLDEPLILPGDEFYMRAFWDLTTERMSSMSMGFIPWSKVVQYGLRAGLDDDMIDVFVAVLRTMDARYVCWQDEESERRRRNK